MSEQMPIMNEKNKKRLLRDVVRLIKKPLTDNGIYYVHDCDNMLKGRAVIFGPSDSLYRYGAYMFTFDFTVDYPYIPPKVTYMTNDGGTRFHPNLYRNGKVCLSLLNTWKGEQWTACQNINSILLNLVTLLHNKPLLNEPGITEKHRDFKTYNSIIQYKNYQTAILGVLTYKILPKEFMGFYNIIKNHFLINKETIIKELETLSASSKNKLLCTTSLYNMELLLNYKDLTKQMKIAFNEYSK
jgi:ubiquitin-protein ligase